uniref:Acyltransferase 3 domain-containing protein n=1 Tax=Prevotella sp. GTC17260 TaxID=3236796 RepID=A0AB33JGQ5_9BACT
MSKDQTTMLKGIAILLMLFLHLFSNPDFATTATPLLWVGDIPFATVLSRACNPVGFFLLCSGYGLAYSHLHGRLFYGGQWRRVLKLYLNYWLILILFVGVGSVVMPEYYPGDLSMILNNMSGLNVDGYNHPAWFLLPYCLLCLTSPLVFRTIDRVGLKLALPVSLLLSLVSMFVISRYIAPAKLHHEWYVLILTYFDLLFFFILGAAVCYVSSVHSLSIGWLKDRQWLVGLLFVLWFAIHCLTDSAALSPVFLFFFILLFLQTDIRGWWRSVLLELGRKSMVMWLIHAFIYGRFFHNFIYGFTYPLLIFLALVVSSYLLAIPIMLLSDKTIGRFEWLNKKS